MAWPTARGIVVNSPALCRERTRSGLSTQGEPGRPPASWFSLLLVLLIRRLTSPRRRCGEVSLAGDRRTSWKCLMLQSSGGEIAIGSPALQEEQTRQLLNAPAESGQPAVSSVTLPHGVPTNWPAHPQSSCGRVFPAASCLALARLLPVLKGHWQPQPENTLFSFFARTSGSSPSKDRRFMGDRFDVVHQCEPMTRLPFRRSRVCCQVYRAAP
jgi:hypothetical protein